MTMEQPKRIFIDSSKIPYSSFFRQRDLIHIRAFFGDEIAIWTLIRLREFFLQALLDNSWGKFSINNPLGQILASEEYKLAQKSNPPSGQG